MQLSDQSGAGMVPLVAEIVQKIGIVDGVWVFSSKRLEDQIVGTVLYHPKAHRFPLQ